MARRQGMGKGTGKGYKNLMMKDPTVHSQSAKGMKQPQRIPKIRKKKYVRPKHETFTLFNRIYDIRKAEEFIKPENIKETKPNQKMLIPLIYFDEKHIKEVNLDNPVIFATDKINNQTFQLLIDGNHRVRKALREKKKIKYIILDEKQTAKIKR